MKLFISADIEGVAGVTRWEETRTGGNGYEQACRQMTLETAAVCEAALEAGHCVTVRDGHGDACNIDARLLPRGVTLIRGWMASPASMMAGLGEGYDGVMYVGYHAPAGSDKSPLAHTISSSRFSRIWLNGRLASEFTLNSHWADASGIPSVFLSGDREICKYAEAEYPGIHTFAVKEGIGGGTVSLHPEDAAEQMKAAAAKALTELPPLRKMPEEYILEIQFASHIDARNAGWFPGAEMVDSHTVRYGAKNYYDVRVALNFMGG